MTVVESLRQTRVCNHLLPPLVGVSWFTVSSYLNDVYLSKDMRKVIFCLAVQIPGIRKARWVRHNRQYLAVLDVPEEYLDDVAHIVNGRYTQLSDRAIDVIEDLSGLQFYNVTPTGLIEHNAIIIAIDHRPAMHPYRQVMAQIMCAELYDESEEWEFDPAAELLSPAKDRETVFYPWDVPGI